MKLTTMITYNLVSTTMTTKILVLTKEEDDGDHSSKKILMMFYLVNSTLFVYSLCLCDERITCVLYERRC